MALLKPAFSPDNLADLTLPLLINVLQSQLMAMYTKHCPLRKSTRNSRHKCSRRYLAHKNRAVSTTPQRKRFALDSHATPALQSYGLPTHLRLAHAMPMPMCLYAPMRRYKQYPPPLPQNNDTPSPPPPPPNAIVTPPSREMSRILPPQPPSMLPLRPPLPLQKPCVSPNSSSSPTSTPTDKTPLHSSPRARPPRGAGQSFADRLDRSACSCRRAATSAGIRCRINDLSTPRVSQPSGGKWGRGRGSTAMRDRQVRHVVHANHALERAEADLVLGRGRF